MDMALSNSADYVGSDGNAAYTGTSYADDITADTYVNNAMDMALSNSADYVGSGYDGSGWGDDF